MNKFFKYIIYFGCIILFAIIMGIVGWLYLAISNALLTFLWAGSHEEIGHGILYTSPFLVIAFTTIGAFLFSLLQEKHGQYPVKPKVYIGQFVTKERIEYKYFYKGFFLAMIPLILGASVGPEASLVGIYFMFYTMSKDIDGYLENRLGIKLVTKPKDKFKERFFTNGLYAIKIIILYVITIATLNVFASWDPFLPFYVRVGAASVNFKEIVLLIPFFIIGYFYTDLYLIMQRTIEKVMDRFKSNIVRVTFTGLCIGIVAVLFPMTVLSGELYAHVILDDLLTKTIIVLLVLTFVKILITHISVAGHIKGGPIYPIMYSVFLFSAAVALLFETDYVFTLVAILSVVMIRIFKNMIAIFIYLLFFFQIKILIVVFVSIYIIKEIIKIIYNKRNNILKEADPSQI